MAQPSPLAPLKEIEAVTITAEDLQEDENVAVFDIYHEFESAWVDFLMTTTSDTAKPEKPHMLQGTTAQRITDLQVKAKDMSDSKAGVETELRRQLNEIKKSRKDLERQYGPLLDAETAKQERIREQISTKIATLHKSMATLEETAPWMHFIQELDRVILNDTMAATAVSSPRHSHPQHALSPHNQKHHRHHQQQQQPHMDAATTTPIAPPVAKPSARALLLAGTTSLADHPQQLAKACQLDNALLRTHVKVLMAEIKRHEDLSPLLKEAGDFLTEHNVWKIMKQQQQQTTTTTTTTSTQALVQSANDNHNRDGGGATTNEKVPAVEQAPSGIGVVGNDEQ
jgi:hypothetical protein